MGTVGLSDALKKAHEVELDLVEIGPSANPPICKILDYGKYKYELEKKQKSKPSHAGEIKEIRLSVTTDEHDFETKVAQAKKFLLKGYKVRVTVKMKGRQNIYHNKAIEQIEKVRESLDGEIEQRATRMGNRFSALIVKVQPAKDKGQTKNDHDKIKPPINETITTNK